MPEYVSSPKKLQLEISSMCNALCLGCVRTDTVNFNQSKPFISKKNIVEVSTIVKLLSSDVMSTVEILEFCGTIDEPLMHPDFFEILESALSINPNYKIIIHTNASVRSTKDWVKLADILRKFKSPHRVNFSIDGIGETHEFYRQFTNYEKILENAQAFINAGGNAVWQFLIFPWNKHQVEEASKLSEQMKFNGFITRIDRSIVTGIGEEKIRKLKNENHVTVVNSQFDISLNDLLSSYAEINPVKISCETQKENQYFVSYDSRLWPCCFIHNGFFQVSKTKTDFLRQRLFNNYGEDFNDMTIKTIEEIVNSDFFKNDLVESWDNDVSTGPCGKITRCAETCNVEKLKVLPIGKHKTLRGSNV
jgi:MoaA/NifB/PqqE/SkfB family radical SAM enzyme